MVNRNCRLGFPAVHQSDAMRTCTRCLEDKDDSLFSRHRKGPGGLQWNCKACCAAYAKQYGAANRKRGNMRVRKWERRNPGKVREKNERKNLLAHGITQDEYDLLLASQGGVCAICRGPSDKRRFSIDHDHACCPGPTSCGGCVRGLLCQRCNAGIGMLKDDVEIVVAAANYLHSSCRAYLTNGEMP